VEHIAEGRDADVFALDARRVLRRYKDGRPADAEAARIAAVHAAGFPAPRVYGVDGPGIVLERLAGPTLGEAVVEGTMEAVEAGALIAGLHDRLHAVPWDGGSLLHLDLHPFNVILAPHGPVVIDWTDSRPGAAGLDVAMTALIFAHSALCPDATPVQGRSLAEIEAVARGLLAGFVAASSERGSDYRAHVAEAVALRRVNPTMSAEELGRLDDAALLVLAPT
jgi:aminoglycoside phosphotransferase (APT) family kinase protein